MMMTVVFAVLFAGFSMRRRRMPKRIARTAMCRAPIPCKRDRLIGAD
jgi:hypothetical protein